MVNIKITPRKTSSQDELRCAMCSKMFESEDDWTKHTLECAKTRRVKRFRCQTTGCTYATNKSCDMKRHIANKHSKKTVESAGETTDWEKQDPGDLIGYISDDSSVERPATKGTGTRHDDGPMIRKPTNPLPVLAPLKRKFSLSPQKIQRAKKIFTGANRPRVTCTITRPTETVITNKADSVLDQSSSVTSQCDKSSEVSRNTLDLPTNEAILINARDRDIDNTTQTQEIPKISTQSVDENVGVRAPLPQNNGPTFGQRQFVDCAVQTVKVNYRHLRRMTKTYIEGGCTIVEMEEEEDQFESPLE